MTPIDIYNIVEGWGRVNIGVNVYYYDKTNLIRMSTSGLHSLDEEVHDTNPTALISTLNKMLKILEHLDFMESNHDIYGKYRRTAHTNYEQWRKSD